MFLKLSDDLSFVPKGDWMQNFRELGTGSFRDDELAIAFRKFQFERDCVFNFFQPCNLV